MTVTGNCVWILLYSALTVFLFLVPPWQMQDSDTAPLMGKKNVHLGLVHIGLVEFF